MAEGIPAGLMGTARHSNKPDAIPDVMAERSGDGAPEEVERIGFRGNAGGGLHQGKARFLLQVLELGQASQPAGGGAGQGIGLVQVTANEAVAGRHGGGLGSGVHGGRW
jgi:hypothetical protein